MVEWGQRERIIKHCLELKGTGSCGEPWLSFFLQGQGQSFYQTQPDKNINSFPSSNPTKEGGTFKLKRVAQRYDDKCENQEGK